MRICFLFRFYYFSTEKDSASRNGFRMITSGAEAQATVGTMSVGARGRFETTEEVTSWQPILASFFR